MSRNDVSGFGDATKRCDDCDDDEVSGDRSYVEPQPAFGRMSHFLWGGGLDLSILLSYCTWYRIRKQLLLSTTHLIPFQTDTALHCTIYQAYPHFSLHLKGEKFIYFTPSSLSLLSSSRQSFGSRNKELIGISSGR